MLKLMSAPGTCALASHIALADAGVEYELVLLDFANDEQRKRDTSRLIRRDHARAHHRSRGLTETPAILATLRRRCRMRALRR